MIWNVTGPLLYQERARYINNVDTSTAKAMGFLAFNSETVASPQFRTAKAGILIYSI